jgi:hypothetical protein
VGRNRTAIQRSGSTCRIFSIGPRCRPAGNCGAQGYRSGRPAASSGTYLRGLSFHRAPRSAGQGSGQERSIRAMNTTEAMAPDQLPAQTPLASAATASTSIPTRQAHPPGCSTSGRRCSIRARYPHLTYRFTPEASKAPIRSQRTVGADPSRRRAGRRWLGTDRYTRGGVRRREVPHNHERRGSERVSRIADGGTL